MENQAVKTSTKARRSADARSRTQLDPQQWVAQAVDVLAREGIGGVRVEVLAKRCGVTKGSFYWHFRDRQALLDALLDDWRTGRLRDIEKVTAVDPTRVGDQLAHIIDVYASSRNRKGMAIELAVRDWARHDAQAAAVVEAVDLYRLECTRQLFLKAGLDNAEAKSRSLLLYACVFGLSLMHYDGFDDNLAALRQRITERIVQP